MEILGLELMYEILERFPTLRFEKFGVRISGEKE